MGGRIWPAKAYKRKNPQVETRGFLRALLWGDSCYALRTNRGDACFAITGRRYLGGGGGSDKHRAILLANAVPKHHVHIPLRNMLFLLNLTQFYPFAPILPARAHTHKRALAHSDIRTLFIYARHQFDDKPRKARQDTLRTLPLSRFVANMRRSKNKASTRL